MDNETQINQAKAKLYKDEETDTVIIYKNLNRYSIFKELKRLTQ